MHGHRSTALPLAWACVALVFYASLYPFEGWRWPPGAHGVELLALPWPRWRDSFDEWANFAGYVPLGALLYVAVVRSGGGQRQALLVAVGVPLLLSYGVEVAQSFMPRRVPSLKDCAFNVAGALVGTGLAAALQSLGWIERWHAVRERWFERDSAVALWLLLLWPVALLFPAPVPLGLGALWSELGDLAEAALAGTPWSDTVSARLGGRAPAAQAPLTNAREVAIVGLGLLAPILLACATSRPGWHRFALVFGALAMACGVSTLSTALNFGPQHALAWWSPLTGAALALASFAALAIVALSSRMAAALGLVSLAVLVTLVAQAPADPYYAANLQGWEQGRFIRFHGLAQWIGWLWPYAAMTWLLARLARRDG
jgi:VanZ family protein